MPIEFDQSTGNPLGPNSTKFKSYVAHLGRSKVNILVQDWHHVEEAIKNQIWQSIMLTYDVPNTKYLKRRWLTYASDRWRHLKQTSLVDTYIGQQTNIFVRCICSLMGRCDRGLLRAERTLPFMRKGHK